MKDKFYAHSLEGRSPDEWQPLEIHLKNVAEITRKFAEGFGAGDWGYLAGLWHDDTKCFSHPEVSSTISGKLIVGRTAKVGLSR